MFRYRKFKNFLFLTFLLICALTVLSPLFLVTQFVFIKGASSLNWDFFTALPKPVGETGGGMAHAILGTFYMVGIGGLIAIPLGIICGIYLSEFSKGTLSSLLRYSIDMMTGVPSIVVGIFAYLILVVPLKTFSALAGGVALAIIILPIVTRSTEEILKLIPNHIREAGLALGLPRWKVIVYVLLKGSRSGIITGVILAISRAAGETAPLLFTAFGSMYFSSSPMEPMASLPVQIYNYAISPYADWQRQAWAGSFLLIIIVLGVNLGVRFYLNKNEVLQVFKRKKGQK
ncbi:MAG: phosphate ABC transporter permease PstA [Bacteriovoracaceae bacterium]